MIADPGRLECRKPAPSLLQMLEVHNGDCQLHPRIHES